MSTTSLEELLKEYDRACNYTNDLWLDLTQDQLTWRPNQESSAIGWHVGHQAAVAHFMIRNLTAAEPSLDRTLDTLMDSATPELKRGELPSIAALNNYRKQSSERVRFQIANIAEGNVGAPQQLKVVAKTTLTTIINHEYQHDKWIAEVRANDLGLALPDQPESDNLTELNGYKVCLLSTERP